ncbi:MAG: LysR substrate-binding domain-containing protein, partial [Alphaproteobacteria bacterium]|nr:LysR substrate-binding domain-containing protein [Alphaproteobacteria bacterium]
DLGLATASGAGAEIARKELFSDAFGIVCPIDHPLAKMPLPVDWPVLGSWPFIGNGICRHIVDERFQQVFASSRLMVRNTTSLLAMVRAGVGVTVLPQLAVERAKDALRFLPVDDSTAVRRIDILRQTHIAPAPATIAFESAIRRATSHGTFAILQSCQA